MPFRGSFGLRPRPRVLRTLSPPVLIAIVAAIVAAELFFIYVLPFASERYTKQIDRAESLLREPTILLRKYESLEMIPPTIGVLYRRQVVANPPEADSLYLRLLPATDDASRLRLLRERAVSDDAYLAALGRCFGGGPQERRLEEFFVRALPHLDPELEGHGYLTSLVATKLYRNYFYAAERSQYAGLIDDARVLYRRFVELGRLLSRNSANDVELHQHLNRASVRLKVMAPEHAFATDEVRAIQDGPADTALDHLHHRDPRLAALARYNAASFLWHDFHHADAIRLLKEDDCGPLRIECTFLLAKVLDSEADSDQGADPLATVTTQDPAGEARNLLNALIGELRDDDPLLDDVYYHRALSAHHRNDTAGALAALQELERCCRNTDLVADVAYLRDLISGRTESLDFYE